MIVHDVEQGSPTWIALRLGIPTASQFHRILTPKTLKLSTQADEYMAEKLAEWSLGHPTDETSNGWMRRGRENEIRGRRWYELEYDLNVDLVGFVTTDDLMAGCSPDFLVGEYGGGEVKCYSAEHHMQYLLDSTAAGKELMQVMGCMWVCGRSWWDLVFWHPTLAPVVIRVERDDRYIAMIAGAVRDFVANLLKERRRLLDMGIKPKECQYAV